MSELIELIEKIVEQKLQDYSFGELAIVTKIFSKQAKDDGHYTCHIRFKNPDARGNFLELYHVPLCTPHLGTVAIPNVGDLVFVSFVQGSIHQPIITGRLYDSKLRPPESDKDEIVQKLPLMETPEEQIKFKMSKKPNADPKRNILLEMEPKLKIQISEEQVSIDFEEKKTSIAIAAKEDPKIELMREKTKISMDSQGNIALSSPKNITLKAKDTLKLEAKHFDFSAKQNIKVTAGKSISTTSKGSQKYEAKIGMTLKSKTSMKLNSNGPIKVKGRLIDLN